MQVCNYVMYACVHKPVYLFVSCLLRHTTFILHIAVFHHEEKRDSNLCVCVCVCVCVSGVGGKGNRRPAQHGTE